MSKITTANFKTENNTFRKLFGGSGLTYTIPRFQRDYSWDEEHWEDLWSDIEGNLDLNGNEIAFHYMGYLLFQSTNDKDFKIIDGQQRLTTITLIILAILKHLENLIKKNDTDNDPEKEKIKKITEDIRRSYIEYLDYSNTHSTKSKLTLNRNNDWYFQGKILKLKELPKNRINNSCKLLKDAFKWFYEKINDYIKSHNDFDESDILIKLVSYISDNLLFTVITVDDEFNSYKVFETLNSRGLSLSSVDLLKNYLFYILDSQKHNDSMLEKLEDLWVSIVNRLQEDKFIDFLRVYWNSRNQLSRKKDLFDVIKKEVGDIKSAFELINNMNDDLDHYLSLTSPELNKKDQDRDNIKILHLMGIKQPYSLLLSAKRNFNEKEFSKLLNAIVTISFRYNIIGKNNPNVQEKIYNKIAMSIHNKTIKSYAKALSFLKDIYIRDEKFKKDFSEKFFSNTNSKNQKIIKYILCTLERKISKNPLNFQDSSITIEHILPQSTTDETSKSFVNNLGNLTLLLKKDNKEAGDKGFSEKLKVYKESNFQITKDIVKNYNKQKEWTVVCITSRQNDMAKQATSIWKIPNLK